VAAGFPGHIPSVTAQSASPKSARAETRFPFGRNWARFLADLNEGRIAAAEASLKEMLELTDLGGRSFLDAGSGSGLFSLAARRLGAVRVHSFDFDAESVACTRELKRRFFPDDPEWTIEQGSVLDAEYLGGLQRFDIVYSWGVLHHTGAMWEALDNVCDLVGPGGQLFIAIYNDQGSASQRWKAVKLAYNRSPLPIKLCLVLATGCYQAGRGMARRLLSLRNPLVVLRDLGGMAPRGMSWWHDLVDWVGGYPFEVAQPEAVFDFCRGRGFALRRLKTAGGGVGNNQFVFERETGLSHDTTGRARNRQ
jgi:2-polyprenyl-3-methyl-5-hydroxy-6-metoxy-1,4-benzoquinol methylase